MFQKSKIQNPQKSPKSQIQNPKSPKSQKPKSPKSKNPQNPKIQNPKSPKSKILYPPTSKIQNSKSPPQSKIWGVGASHKELLHNDPKSKIQKIWPKKFGLGILGFWIWDSGPKIQNPNSPKSKISKIPKIQNLKSPKSKIQNPKSPKSKIQNPTSSAEIQNLGRWGPHVKNCFLMMQNPKSKIPKIRLKTFGFWILGILDFEDFGFWDFGAFGFWIVGILDFGFGRFWILGFLGILGFWDFEDFGFWIFWILDFGDFGFWGFWILVILGRSRGCTTRQFGDGAWRSEARIPLLGCLWGATSQPTVSNRVGARKQIEHFCRGQNPTKITENLDFQPRGQNFTK